MNSVSILFSWHKNFGGVIKRHCYLPWRKVSYGCLETNRELERIFNSYRYQIKKYVIDLFIYLNSKSVCWWKQHASENSLNLFRLQNAKDVIPLTNLEKNTKRKDFRTRRGKFWGRRREPPGGSGSMPPPPPKKILKYRGSEILL